MAGSQLKRLKASLREQGIVGPQKSKKQKKQSAQDAQATKEKRLKRSVALDGIREQFNPFQFHTNARGPKFEVTTKTNASTSRIKGRPGVAKSIGEERASLPNWLLTQARENDPSMAPEERALQRFAMEKQRSHKKGSIFDLEDDGDEVSLTHMGKSLTFDDDDDFDEADLPSETESEIAKINVSRLKRMRGEDDNSDGEDGEELPERKKTKQEIYKEIIEKSKAHKYERQQIKEADEDLREKIDGEFADLRNLLYTTSAKPERPGAEAEQPKLVAGMEKDKFDKAYDVRVKQLVQDKRAQPSSRTKTDEEKAAEESARLKELEEKRLKRMRGEEVSDEEEEEEEESSDESDEGESEEDDEFQLGKGIKMRPTATELGFDDEDDFIIDDDLVASGSDIEPEDSDEDDESDAESSGSEAEADGDESEDEFTKGLLTETEIKNAEFTAKNGDAKDDSDGVPFTFPCPRTHAELLEITKEVPVAKLTTVIQRIRALHHSKLAMGNKERLGVFSRVLVQHIAHLGNSDAPSAPIEGLIRHVHSLAKTYPLEISREFRLHLQAIGNERPLAIVKGDLMIMTAIGSIYPTSDHFHRVVTPAMLTMARYLGQSVPRTLANYATGLYLAILSLQYQAFSKRYVPEVMNSVLNTLLALAPVEYAEELGFFPVHRPTPEIRMKDGQGQTVGKLNCHDCSSSSTKSPNCLKVAILDTSLKVLSSAADLWSGKSAFFETFETATKVLSHLTSKACKSHLPPSIVKEATRLQKHLTASLNSARLSRRPLELHHHKPVAIRTYVPKFEDSFDPNKHYDPDRERAELAKLRAEHKKERKGAMRELRKDANFMAREKLRIKKVKDEAYEKKFQRIVAEIQTEEGREANAYEREKAQRKRARK
ncbi:nucleolar complex protein 14 [Pyricularia oryzae Y34]|uniref:Nucleolar complex protein 14 n=2 Tax=Pyricularia oryzae TaxID=318829 RepID=A0AA97NMV1_PYRO3|nr:nucleolar complex protein 14 [Pyricularia oryzae Y34]